MLDGMNDRSSLDLRLTWPTMLLISEDSAEELNRTCNLGNLIDKFIEPKIGQIGQCVHQCSIEGQHPDFAIVPQKFPLSVKDFVAISDYKATNIDAAMVESFAYSRRVSQTHADLRFVFAATRNEFCLHLNFGLDGYVLTIPIIHAKSTKEKAIAWCVLKKGCKILLDRKLTSMQPHYFL